MAIGPGKYDQESSDIQAAYQAAGVIVMVMGGTKGEGFSVTGTLPFTFAIPKILRSIADQIEADVKKEFPEQVFDGST